MIIIYRPKVALSILLVSSILSQGKEKPGFHGDFKWAFQRRADGPLAHHISGTSPVKQSHNPAFEHRPSVHVELLL